MLAGLLQGCQLRCGPRALPFLTVRRQGPIGQGGTVWSGIILQLLLQQMQEELLERLGC